MTIERVPEFPSLSIIRHPLIQHKLTILRNRETPTKTFKELVDEIALVGSPERIRDRLQVWKESSKDGAIGTMLLGGAGTDALRVVAEAVL